MFSRSNRKVNINIIILFRVLFRSFRRPDPGFISIAVHVKIVMGLGYEGRRQVFLQVLGGFPSEIFTPMLHSLYYKMDG